MNIPDKFEFTLSLELQVDSPIIDYEAIKRQERDCYEIWWDVGKDSEDHINYSIDDVERLVEEGHWIIKE